MLNLISLDKMIDKIKRVFKSYRDSINWVTFSIMFFVGVIATAINKPTLYDFISLAGVFFCMSMIVWITNKQA